MTDLILSLFPGIGLLDKAFEDAGFCVVRGPDLLWGGDVKQFHPPENHFVGVIGGPPCKAFSQLVYVVRANGGQVAENLIPEFERCVVEAAPKWFLMENVAKAPEPYVPGYSVSRFEINNRWVGGEQNRVRAFSFGLFGSEKVDLRKWIDYSALENFDWSPAVCAAGGIKPGITGDRKTRLKYLGWKTATALKESIRLQGLPDDYLSDAPFTLKGKHQVIGNGVPLPLGKAVAKAVKSYVGA
jgi:DNA (cytosine-5)-methyltransferase 1